VLLLVGVEHPLDVSEIHGFRPDLGLRIFTPKALKGVRKT